MAQALQEAETRDKMAAEKAFQMEEEDLMDQETFFRARQEQRVPLRPSHPLFYWASFFLNANCLMPVIQLSHRPDPSAPSPPSHAYRWVQVQCIS